MRHRLYHFPDKTIIRLKLEDASVLAEMEKTIYTEGFIETQNSLEELFGQSDLNLGIIMDHKLVGFLLVTKEFTTHDNEIFIYDIAILPNYQKKGLGSILLKYFLAETHERKIKILLSCRNTSYPMFSNSVKIEKMGYRIACDKFCKDGYFKLYGIHEDRHDIELEPIV